MGHNVNFLKISKHIQLALYYFVGLGVKIHEDEELIWPSLGLLCVLILLCWDLVRRNVVL